MNRCVASVVFLAFSAMNGLDSYAQVGPRTPAAGVSPSGTDLQRAQLDFDRERWAQQLELERSKLRQELDIERQRAGERANTESSARLTTAASVVLPLLVALGTVFYQVRSAAKTKDFEAQTARDLKKSESEVSFQLKAIEMVLNAPTPWAAERRAELLKSMLTTRLPENFVATVAKQVEDKKFPGVRKYEMSMELLKSLASAKTPQEEARILELWQNAFEPDKEWLSRIRSQRSTKPDEVTQGS